MENVSSNVTGVGGASVPPRCYGHRRSSSLPIPPAPIQGKQLCNGNESTNHRNGKNHPGSDPVDLTGIVDAFNQISESLSRPAKILMEILDQRNENVDNTNKGMFHDSNDRSYSVEKIGTALKQLNTIQGNLKHVLPHMETILNDYKTIKERTQSRDEMLKTLDKALRRSEGRSRALRGELQDMRDENKCLKEKAQQNESILRFLNTDQNEGTAGNKRTKQNDKGSKRSIWNRRYDNESLERSGSVGKLEQTTELDSGESLYSTDGPNRDLGAKLEHYQKVLCDYETQLQEVVLLNKDLILKINERESEVMNLNCELLKHQETLTVYEEGFKNLSNDNNHLDTALREERKRAAELSEKLDDTEGYISCITDKVASYEVELKYLKQELKKREK